MYKQGKKIIIFIQKFSIMESFCGLVYSMQFVVLKLGCFFYTNITPKPDIKYVTKYY